MPSAMKLLALPVGLIIASAVGVVGSWAMPLGAVLLLAACVAGAVAMESQDLASVEGLSPSVVEPVQESMLEVA